MAGIDAHQHFWKFNPVRDAWITDEMSVIQRDFLPADLAPILKQQGLDGCVVVQSDQSEQENIFQLNNAANYNFIRGVVGWVDLQAKNIKEQLTQYKSFPKMKGFRHVLQGEAQRDLMLAPAFMNGIKHLGAFNFTYDILVFPDQLKYIPDFVKAFPNQRFVIDHIAKPFIKDGIIDQWKKDISEIACFDNVSCKISGMVTEADWGNWAYEDFVPYLDTVVNAFGAKRILFGSDWPVCNVAGGYEKMIGIVRTYFSSFTDHEQNLFFGENAIQFYNLI